VLLGASRGSYLVFRRNCGAFALQHNAKQIKENERMFPEVDPRDTRRRSDPFYQILHAVEHEVSKRSVSAA
jgi:hypothetical protein